MEEALRLVPTLSPVTLGRREPAALEDQEPDKAEAEDVFDIYKKWVASLKKAVNSYCTQANKLTTLKKSLEEADPKQKQDPQHSASLQAVEYYESQMAPTKNKWLEVLAEFPGSLDKASEKEVTTKLEEAKHKLECEHDLKNLQRALAPTKAWLKNTGLEA